MEAIINLAKLHPERSKDFRRWLRRSAASAGDMFDQESLYQRNARVAVIKTLFAFDGKTIEEAVGFEPIFDGLWSGIWHSVENLLARWRFIEAEKHLDTLGRSVLRFGTSDDGAKNLVEIAFCAPPIY
jgi:hypothetical protein